jgi:hypothetical protein
LRVQQIVEEENLVATLQRLEKETKDGEHAKAKKF